MIVSHKHGDFLGGNEIPFRGLKFFREVQAVNQGFGQGHFAGCIRGEGVDFFLVGIENRLRHIVSFGVFQFEGGMRRRDGIPGFGVNLDKFQPVMDGLIVDNHGGRVAGVFGAANEDVKGRFDSVALFAFDLLHSVDAVRQQLRFRLSIFT